MNGTGNLTDVEQMIAKLNFRLPELAHDLLDATLLRRHPGLLSSIQIMRSLDPFKGARSSN